MAKMYPDQFERAFWIKKDYTWFKGMAFFENRSTLKEAAAQLRAAFKIPIRSVIIPESSTDGGAFGGCFERYLLMIPNDCSKTTGLVDAIRKSEGFESD